MKIKGTCVNSGSEIRLDDTKVPVHQAEQEVNVQGLLFAQYSKTGQHLNFKDFNLERDVENQNKSRLLFTQIFGKDKTAVKVNQY